MAIFIFFKQLLVSLNYLFDTTLDNELFKSLTV